MPTKNPTCRGIIWAAVSATAVVCLGQSVAWPDTGLGRHKQLYAVPAPGRVSVDGKLDDWDLSGQIEMLSSLKRKEMQNAKFAMMYDRRRFIFGVVRDHPQ